jgi:hypothetical protein
VFMVYSLSWCYVDDMLVASISWLKSISYRLNWLGLLMKDPRETKQILGIKVYKDGKNGKL